MTGRVMIVTGANSGIGYEVAKYLCEGGNDVVITCKSREKGAETVERIKEELPDGLIEFMELDLCSSQSIRDFVNKFVKKKKKLSVLVNNAGMALEHNHLTIQRTVDNFEVTMATNHLGPFLLTNLLLDYMIQTAHILGEARIINVTCSLHDHENSFLARGLDFLDVENFQLEKEGTFNGLQAYKNAKLCNVLTAYYLSERLKSSSVTINSVDPGLVPTTNLYRHASWLHKFVGTCCLHHALRCCNITKTQTQAATSIAEIATSDNYTGQSGKFFRDGIVERSSVESYDKDLQRDVWKKTWKLVGLKASIDEDFDDISLGPSTPLLKHGN